MLYKVGEMDTQGLKIADKVFESRLLLGSARYPDPQTLQEALEASGTELVTLAIRRLDLKSSHSEGILRYLDTDRYHLLPNTAGCYTAKDAVLTAQLAREALETNWVKLEVIGDDKTLLPDVVELLKAASELVREGFTVLPYCTDDLISCRKLADIGCAAVMPLASPIGSGMGIRNPYNIQMIREHVDIPLVIDAGIGTASDAAIAMELGADAVLVNTAISQSQHPVAMARAMKLTCEGGRLAYLSGRIPRKLYAESSSPLDGLVGM